MIEIKLFDRKVEELNFGDIVKISDGKRFTFYSEVKYLEFENAIAPFHTFAFMSFEKADLPAHAKKCKEERYDCWFVDHETDEDSEKYGNQYLMDWRHCESLLRAFKFYVK